MGTYDNKTDIQVLSAYFGKKPGTTIQEFGKELKDLSPEEKAVLATGIRNDSLTY